MAQPGPHTVHDATAEETFARTEHDLAQWNLVPAEQKRYGRLHVLESLNERIKEGMHWWGNRGASLVE